MILANNRGRIEFFGVWMPARGIFLVAFALLILVIGGIYTGATWGDVGAGYSSVIRNTYTGRVQPGPSGPLNRPFIKQAFFEDVIPIYTSVSSMKFCGGYDSNLTELPNGQPGQGCDAASPIGTTQDQIRVAVDVNIFWTVNNQGNKLVQLYQSYPNLDYANRVFVPTIREVVREVIANRTFDQVFAQLNTLPIVIANKTVSTIANNPTLAGIINMDPASVQITNIHMSNALQTSLQAKKQSEIGIQTAENQRNQTIINADANRQQQILQAQGLAQAQIIQANATRDAIRNVLESVGCGSNSTCTQQAGDLYLQLSLLKQICATGTNCIFLIGQNSNGQPIIYQLPAQTQTSQNQTAPAK